MTELPRVLASLEEGTIWDVGFSVVHILALILPMNSTR